MNFGFRKNDVSIRGDQFDFGNVNVHNVEAIKLGEIKPLKDDNELLGYTREIIIQNGNDELSITLFSKIKENLQE